MILSERGRGDSLPRRNRYRGRSAQRNILHSVVSGAQAVVRKNKRAGDVTTSGRRKANDVGACARRERTWGFRRA
jgi:hypothetical protein